MQSDYDIDEIKSKIKYIDSSISILNKIVIEMQQQIFKLSKKNENITKKDN